VIFKSSSGLQLQTTSDPLSKIMVVLDAGCYLFFEFNLNHSLRIVVQNANSVKPNKLELANFLSINNLDTVAITETQLALKHRFSIPGWCVLCADWNEFGGGVVFLVKNNLHHDQFTLPNVVNLETITVCFYLHNNTHLLFASCYNPPDSPILHSDLDSVFSSFDCYSSWWYEL